MSWNSTNIGVAGIFDARCLPSLSRNWVDSNQQQVPSLGWKTFGRFWRLPQSCSQGYAQINFSSKSYISTASVATIYDSVALSISLPVCLTSCRWPVFCGHLIPTLLYNCTNQLKFVNWVCLSFIQWISCWSNNKYCRVRGKTSETFYLKKEIFSSLENQGLYLQIWSKSLQRFLLKLDADFCC